MLLLAWLGLLTLLALHLTMKLTKTDSSGSELPPSDPPLNTRQGDDEEGGALTSLGRLERSEYVASVVKTLLNRTKSNDHRSSFETVVALSSLLPRMRNISRLKTPAPEAFRNYIAPVGLPVIFTDMLEGTSLRQWSWEYVRTKWGHQVFQNTRQGDYSSKKSASGKYAVNRVSVTLGDFIDVATGLREPKPSEKGLYITKQRIIPPEDLEEEFYYPPFYSGNHKSCYLEPTAWYI